MPDAHPLAERYPLMDGDEFAAFKADVLANGLRNPIWLFEGKILDGRNRLRACREIGLEPVLAEFEGTEAEAAAFVDSQNLHRRHLSAEWRRERVKELRAKGMSLRSIGEEMGIDKRQVQRDLGTLSPPAPTPPAAAPEPPPVATPESTPAARVTGADGKTYPAKRPAPKPAPKPAPRPAKPLPAAWAAIATTLTTLATQIEQIVPTPAENERPWELIRSLEETAASLLRQATRLKRRHHL